MGQGERPVKVDTVLILAGKQGARKSTAFRVLAGDDWFSDTAIDIRSKDSFQSIRGVWLYELAELAATRPRDAESVKAFLSAPTDRYRPPYGRNVVESHRQCVFVGTTNEATFLSDPTGARRFWPVSVGTIDIDAIRHDRGLLWAEAVEAYRAGEPWWLDPDEDRALSDAQEQYQHEDPWLVTLDRWMASAENRAQASRGMRVGELLTAAVHMDEDRQKKGDEMRFGAVLQGAGWEKRRTRRDGHQLRLWFPPGTP
jgi:predicted P-loop ATPase